MENYILEIKNLKKTYQTKNAEIEAISNFDISLKKGEFVAIIGPSGCGKSTILSILSGIDKEYKGNIKKDENIKFGYMLQQDALFNWLNVLNNSIIGLNIEKKVNEKSKQYVIDLLKTYGLKDFIYSYPNNLSGGMRQRVALIRTLATKPDIILLDEPFSALDYQTRLKVSNDVYKILKKEGKSAIMVTHDIAEAITMADRVIILSKRPSYVKKIINVTFDNRDDFMKIRNSLEFNKYYDIIWKEIDNNV